MKRKKKIKDHKEEEKGSNEQHAPKGWKSIDLSEPPQGPLMRTRTSMGTEEPKWPEGDDDPAIEDEGDITS